MIMPVSWLQPTTSVPSASAPRAVAVDLVGRYLSEYAEWFLGRDLERDTADVSQIPILRSSLLSIVLL